MTRATIEQPGPRRLVELNDSDVVVTGIGLVTPIGNDLATVWDAIMRAEGTAATRLSDKEIDGLPDPFACVLDEQSEAQLAQLPKQIRRRSARATQMALACSIAAIEDADLDDVSSADVFMGSGGGCLASAYEERDTFLNSGLKRVTPFAVPMALASAIAGDIAQYHGCHGEVYTLATACASGASAIANGVRAIQSGHSDIAIVGGADAPVIDTILAGFTRLQALATGGDPSQASRPFDESRNGFVLSEGAAVLILESRRNADERGAKAYATLSGVGSTNDAFHPVAPVPEATYATQSIQRALRSAGRMPNEVASVNVHGTSTLLNDVHETKALHQAFGERDDLITTAPKGVTGHLLGASAALEAVLTILSVQHGVVPPTANLSEPIPGLHFAPPGGCELASPVAVSTSFGFGGFNVSLVVESADRA